MARCRSFVALYPEGFDSTEEPTWFPEYDIDLGRPLAAVAANLQAMCSGTVAGRACSGVYRREFERGLVLVNPSDETRRYPLPSLPAGQRYQLVWFSGGGRVDSNGHRAAQELGSRPVTGPEVVLPPHSGRVLVKQSTG
jgi:hypothetical protein